jgi:hypothetical protein
MPSFLELAEKARREISDNAVIRSAIILNFKLEIGFQFRISPIKNFF